MVPLLHTYLGVDLFFLVAREGSAEVRDGAVCLPVVELIPVEELSLLIACSKVNQDIARVLTFLLPHLHAHKQAPAEQGQSVSTRKSIPSQRMQDIMQVARKVVW